MSRENDSKAIQRVSTDEHTRGKVIESLVLRGDLSGLAPVERARHYRRVCDDLGLNPDSQPFAFLRLNGKEILYATRGATDQLAKIHRVTREIIDGPKVIDLAGTKLVYAVCKATLPDGRMETATATVPLVDPVNVLMKCETKVKRRATLSILGLGLLDETEVETIPANVQEPSGGVDLTLGQPSSSDEVHQAEAEGDESRGDETPATLKEFLDHVADVELPGESVRVWLMHRAALSALPAADRETAWKALCARTEEVGKMKNAKVWLRKAIAEEDARRTPSALAEETEQPGVLAGIDAAGDLDELRRLTVEVLDVYPALAESTWTAALAAAKRLGCDEPTFRRMVAEAMGDDPQPPAGGAGGSATGGKSSAHGKGASGAQGAPAARAANDVTELAVVSDAAQAILERHGANLWGLRGALKKHRDELRPTDVPELARVLAKITPPDPATKAVLTQVGAEKIVCGLTGLKRAA